MSRSRKYFMIVLAGAVALSAILPPFIRADAPATTAPAKAARPIDTILADLKATQAKLSELVPYPKLLGDAKFRKENGEQVIPHLTKMAELNEIATAHDIPDAGRDRLQVLSMAVAMGDKPSAAILTEVAAGKNPEDALAAKSFLVLGNWANASDDAKAQQKILDDYAVTAKEAAKSLTDLNAERDAANAAAAGKPADPAAQKLAVDRDAAIAKANARQENIAETLSVMSQLGAANDDLSKKAVTLIKTTLNSQGAKEVAAAMEADQAQRNLLGRPIKIAGRTTTNGKLDASEWKGKVVLVDFWATWCGPCVESLPEIKKVYNEYHAKGLEMVGVNLDSSDDRVNAFTKENAMPWPQLRELTQTDDDNDHPLARKYGVDGIPTLFLIDKKGVLRYIDARESLEEKVKKLLEEPDPKAPAPAPATPPTPAPTPAPAK